APLLPVAPVTPDCPLAPVSPEAPLCPLAPVAPCNAEALDHEAKPLASEVSTLPAPGLPPRIVIWPLTSNALVGAVVPMPTFPEWTILMASVLPLLVLKSMKSLAGALAPQVDCRIR